MPAYTDVIAAWQPYFITLAASCATLAGLLFVALSLHIATLAQPQNINLRRLSNHTFGSFVTIMFISLFFIVPDETALYYGGATLVTTAFGFAHMAARLLETLRDKEHRLHRRYYLRRALTGTLSYLLFAIGGVLLLLQPGSAALAEQSTSAMTSTSGLLYHPVVFIFIGSALMLITSMRHCWYLLAHELR